ncbi:MAG: hypothetical protein ACREDL_09615, partial [Bradyrhizobium sp.]
FRDLVIDGKELAQQGTPVIISGAYEEFGGIESLSPPHSVFSTDMVRLDTSNTPREIREFLYSCHQRAETAETNGLFLATCEVRITGTLTTCSLAIAPSVKLPCIEVEKAEAERPDSSSGTPATSVQQ